MRFSSPRFLLAQGQGHYFCVDSKGVRAKKHQSQWAKRKQFRLKCLATVFGGSCVPCLRQGHHYCADIALSIPTKVTNIVLRRRVFGLFAAFLTIRGH